MEQDRFALSKNQNPIISCDAARIWLLNVDPQVKYRIINIDNQEIDSHTLKSSQLTTPKSTKNE